MNGRSLIPIICVLFAVGILWMIFLMPAVEPSKEGLALLEPVAPDRKEIGAGTEVAADTEEPEPLPPATEETQPPQESSEQKIVHTPSVEPPDTVTYAPKYGQVTFTHLAHLEDYDIDCGQCHHEDMEGGMARCTNCHDVPKEVFHENCAGCHKELQKEGKETGPVKCKECHTKESAATEPSEQGEEDFPEKESPGEKPEQKVEKGPAMEPPDTVTYTPKYGDVTFTHLAHLEDYDIDCGQCHHEDMEGGMARCTNCHDPPKEVLHKNCAGCHKQLEKEGKTTGPTKCRECHVKEMT